uniref:Uncharacterized protein n=1 Tax=Biomphalaria glabrata TaxID=6526 RepID=A0A2C9JEH9_BIOGL
MVSGGDLYSATDFCADMDVLVLHTYVCFLFMLVIVKIEPAAIACPGSTTLCNTTHTCIENKYICDGDRDCDDGEDEANCEFKESGCGDRSYHIAQTGTISSKNYPLNYTSYLHCQWYISSPDNTPLQLEFIEIFDLEKPRHNQCLYDFVSVLQMSPTLSLGRFCGGTPPAPMLLNASKVLVEFQSDGQKSGYGFKLRWTSGNNIIYSHGHQSRAQESGQIQTTQVSTTAHSQCLGQFEYGGDLGHISSPNYGQPYMTPLYCRWQITVSPGYRVSLQFLSIDIGEATVNGCASGRLEVYDGPDDGAPLIDTYCGDVMPTPLMTSDNTLYLVMTADNNTAGRVGFQANYMSLYIEPPTTTTIGPPPPGCDGTALVISSMSGYITTPYYDHQNIYADRVDCEWILLAPPGQVFLISFVEFDLEQSGGCDSDYLRIYDDNEDRLGFSNNLTNGTIAVRNETLSDVNYLYKIANLCGQMLPYSVESNNSTVVLRFHSDEQYGSYGFNLTYLTKVPEVKCSAGQFQCDSVHCIDQSAVCDGQANCDASLSCGLPAIQPEVARIVGGTEAVEGAWPWTLSIVDKERPGHICGATLIHPKWALSAAHCFERVFSRNYEQFALVAGRHHLLLTDSHEQWRFVDDVYMNREYVSATSENDIALIKLKQPFNLNDYVSLVCLPEQRVTPGTPCYITGWGETLGTCCRNLLKQALVPIMNSSLCSGPEYYGSRLMDHMMCAGYPEGGVDSCDGDSGGPLVCQSPTGSRRWELQGVTSWGLLCASAKSPGVYTVVDDFIFWIRQTIAIHT